MHNSFIIDGIKIKANIMKNCHEYDDMKDIGDVLNVKHWFETFND